MRPSPSPPLLRLSHSLALYLLGFLPLQDLGVVARLHRGAAALTRVAIQRTTSLCLSDDEWPTWKVAPPLLYHAVAHCKTLREVVICKQEVASGRPDILPLLGRAFGATLERLSIHRRLPLVGPTDFRILSSLRVLDVSHRLSAAMTRRLLEAAPHLETLSLFSCDTPSLCAAFPASLRVLRLGVFLAAHHEALFAAAAAAAAPLEELALCVSSTESTVSVVGRLLDRLDDRSGTLPHLERLDISCDRPVHMRRRAQRPVSLRRLRALALRNIPAEALQTGERLEELTLWPSTHRGKAGFGFSSLPARHPSLHTLRLVYTLPESSLWWFSRWQRHLRRPQQLPSWATGLRTADLRLRGGIDGILTGAPSLPHRLLLGHLVRGFLQRLSALRKLSLDLGDTPPPKDTLVRLLVCLPALHDLSLTYSAASSVRSRSRSGGSGGDPAEAVHHVDLRRLSLRRWGGLLERSSGHRQELLAKALDDWFGVRLHLPHLAELRLHDLPDRVDLAPLLERTALTLTPDSRNQAVNCQLSVN